MRQVASEILFRGLGVSGFNKDQSRDEIIGLCLVLSGSIDDLMF